MSLWPFDEKKGLWDGNASKRKVSSKTTFFSRMTSYFHPLELTVVIAGRFMFRFGTARQQSKSLYVQAKKDVTREKTMKIASLHGHTKDERYH